MLKMLQRFWQTCTAVIVLCGLWLLEAMLPMRGRRLFFLTTMYMQVCKLPLQPSEDMLEPLVREMHIAQFKKSLMLPALFAQHIWKDTQLQHFITLLQQSTGKSEAQEALLLQIAGSVVEITPRWMYYGRRDDMLNDAVNLFGMAVRQQNPQPS